MSASVRPPLGYCTNVHAGADATQMLANLRRFAPRVKATFSPHEPMGVGLWFSDAAARSVDAIALRDWLDESDLVAFTANAFPFGDFHEPVVKHRVYEPSWSDPRRLDYTLRVAELMVDLNEGARREVSVSTLPIGWPSPPCAAVNLSRAADQLRQLARALASLEARRGVLVHVSLEPEPGCILARSADVVNFFEHHLLAGQTVDDEAIIRRHIRVCHDVCHAAVMFEDQRAVLSRYRDAGLRVGKMQVSSAVGVDFDALDADARRRALAQLRGFAEPRYLHQASVRTRTGDMSFFEDLPAALAAAGDNPAGEWRVHFHVPIFMRQLGDLSTTQSDIAAALAAAPEVTHLEVETYAWNVLPGDVSSEDLSVGIARELTWLRDLLGPGAEAAS